MRLPDITSSPRFAGSRTVLLVGVTLAIAAACLSGLVINYFYVHFKFMGAEPTSGDHLASASGAAATALLLTAAALPLRMLRAPVWLWVVLAAATAFQVVLAVMSFAEAGEATQETRFANWPDGVVVAFLVPSSWPLLVALAVSVVLALRQPRVAAPDGR